MARVIPGSAPRMNTGPHRACPIGPSMFVRAVLRGGGPAFGSNVVTEKFSRPHSASRVLNRTVSPDSMVRIGLRSHEKNPCRVFSLGSILKVVMNYFLHPELTESHEIIITICFPYIKE